MAKSARKVLSVMLSIGLACLMTPLTALGAEEQGGGAQEDATLEAAAQQDAVRENATQDAAAQDASLQDAGAQEGVTYRVATLADPEDPEEGLTWTDEICTDYTVMTADTRNWNNQTIVVDGTIDTHEIVVTGTVNLILTDTCNLTVFKSTKQAICVNEGATLNIYGQTNNSGKLNATSQGSAAGIGGESGKSCGAINIYGGTITACTEMQSTSGYYYPAAGIGGGKNGSGKNIAIYGGVVTAKSRYGAGIGGGYGGSCDGIYIYGGIVYAEGGTRAAGIGSGYEADASDIFIYGGTVEATAGTYSAAIGGGDGGNASNLHLYDGTVTVHPDFSAPGFGARGNATDLYIHGGTYTADTRSLGSSASESAGIGCGAGYTAKNICISGGTITIYAGEYAAAIGCSVSGSVDGITISGGTLEVTGGDCAAAIGGGKESTAKNIKISGGTIKKAQGGSKGAGIGGGKSGSVSDIAISGGTVSATGGEDGAGIGGGDEGSTEGIKISGGSVTAVGGAEQGTCIGGGDEGPASGIEITGGVVRAMRSNNGSAAIGGGRNRGCGDIVIRDCVIEAQGGYWAPAIGTGCSCPKDSTNSVTIENAIVKCYRGGGDDYPTIGLGPWANSGATCTVTIGEGCGLWSLSEGTPLVQGAADVTSQVGAFDVAVTNGSIEAEGIGTEVTGFDPSVPQEYRDRIQAKLSKISVVPSSNLALLESQYSIAQAALGLSDDDLLAIMADPGKRIGLSLTFEMEVVAADFSSASGSTVEYSLKPVATAVLYGGPDGPESSSITLTADQLKAAKGTLTVTLPVPDGTVPTRIVHTNDERTLTYDSFLPDGVKTFTYDSGAGTVSFTITHCSLLASSFEARAQAGAAPATGDGAAVPLAAAAMAALVAGALAAIARRRAAR